MPVIELHFFAANDLNGPTVLECSTDDAFVKSVELDIQRDRLGSGLVNFARKVPTGLFSNDILQPENFVRVLIPSVHATKYLHGFFLDLRQQKVVSKKEKGGEGFTFGGPGPKFYLTRTLLWSASFAGFSNAVERENGIWTWPSTARAGAILNRLILEDQANPSGPFLPDLTKSFSDANDSNAVAWADDIAGTEDFTLRIQDDYLKVLWQLEDAAAFTTQFNLGEVGAPLMQLDAYQTFGRDLTGAMAVDTVHFTEGVDIRNDLNVEAESLLKGSHSLVKGNDGVYELAVAPGYDPGEVKKVVPSAYDSSNNAVLDSAGRRFLQRQKKAEHQKDLRIVTGFDPANGLYTPGPDGTDGHFWVGDIVSLSTGQSSPTELDYTDEAGDVTGIEIELEEAVKAGTDLEHARSLAVMVQINEERQSSNTTSNQGKNRTTAGTAKPLRLCRAGVFAEESSWRWYDSDVNSDIDGLVSAAAAWDADTSTGGIQSLTDTPDASYGTAANEASSNAGDVAGLDILYRRMAVELDADQAAALAAGGATLKGQRKARARSGIGISEAAQDMISQDVVRVIQADGTVRGTAMAAHSLPDSSGSSKWPASATEVNKQHPPAAASPVLSAVPGTIAGDFLLIEEGSRNFTVSTETSGGNLYVDSTSAVDLPEGDAETADQRSWWELSVGSSEVLATVHDGRPELIGTGTRAKRCSDTEHYFSESAPTTDDNFPDRGFRYATHWVQVDDIDTPTAAVGTWMLIDEDAGTWIDIFGGGGGAGVTVGFVTIAKWAND